MEALIHYLNSIRPLSPELIAYLQGVLRERQLHKKEFLLKAGHICRTVCFIQSGLFRCFYEREGHDICSWFMKEGDVIISVASFFDQKESYESIQAIEDSSIYFIEFNQLEFAYRNFPEFNYVGRVLLQKYYQQSEQRLYALRMQRAHERYDHLLKSNASLVLRVPAKFIASYLGLSEAHFSVIKSRQ